MNNITMTLNADELIKMALREDISSEDVTTNSVMPEAKPGEVELICKQDGIICGMDIYERVFKLLDQETVVEKYVKDGDELKKCQHKAKLNGDNRVLLSCETVDLN